jgi:hypothetical protein
LCFKLVVFVGVGCIVVGCVEKIARVLIDPSVAEVVLFKDRSVALFCITYYVFKIMQHACCCGFFLCGG